MSPQVLSAAFVILCSLLLYQLALIFAPFFTPILWDSILVRLNRGIHGMGGSFAVSDDGKAMVSLAGKKM